MLTYSFRWLLPAGLLLTLPLAQAQAISEPAISARVLPYRSAFENYHRFKDQPVVSWREANDTVGKAGGGMGVNEDAQPITTKKTSAAATTGHGANSDMAKGTSGSPMSHGGKP